MFLNEDEIKLENEYLEQGYIVRPVADLLALEWIRSKFIGLISETLDFDVNSKPETILNLIHQNSHKVTTC